MMKTILIMRHGKSSWKQKDIEDHERPLKKRGKKCTEIIGEMVIKKELVPQVILCSTAVRAQQTAERFMEAVQFNGKIEYLDELYLAEEEKVAQILAQLPDEIERAMVIGHNPGLEGLVQELDKHVKSMPTAALACFALQIKSWKDFDLKTEAELVGYWKPAELKKKK
jgi:phosphohistidine phosphatase